MIDGDYQHDDEQPRGKVTVDHALGHLIESDPQPCERCDFNPALQQLLGHSDKGVRWFSITGF